MRLSATLVIVACCAMTLVGCCGRHHRKSCLFGDRFKNKRCVDREEWDSCDDVEYDDDDRCDCGHHGGQMMPDYGMPMQSFDSGCGCGGGSSMPAYYGGGMPMSFDSYPQSSNCGCGGGGGGMMSMPSYPTFDQPTMMMQPTPTPAATPTPAQIGPATGVPDSYYSPQQTTPTVAIPPKY